MKSTNEAGPEGSVQQSAVEAIADLKASGALDALFAKIDAGELQLTGEGGFVPGLIKAALERGLQVELSDHLGYERGDKEVRLFTNSRTGRRPRRCPARSARSGWTSPGTGTGRSPRAWSRPDPGVLAGWTT